LTPNLHVVNLDIKLADIASSATLVTVSSAAEGIRE